jgi:hypothetical protein
MPLCEVTLYATGEEKSFGVTPDCWADPFTLTIALSEVLKLATNAFVFVPGGRNINILLPLMDALELTGMELEDWRKEKPVIVAEDELAGVDLLHEKIRTASKRTIIFLRLKGVPIELLRIKCFF